MNIKETVFNRDEYDKAQDLRLMKLNQAAKLQAEAWRILKRKNPNYASSDVEATDQWVQARLIVRQVTEQ